MGQKLVLYYKYISDKAGRDGKTQLAQKTKIPLIEAATVPDTPERIALFKKALQEITGEVPPGYIDR